MADIAGLHSWSMIFNELKRNSGYSALLYYPLFCIRRLLVSVVLLLLAEYEIAQCITQFILNFVVTSSQFGLHIFLTLPFANTTVMILSWYGELCISGVFMLLPVFLWPWGDTGELIIVTSVKVIVMSSIGLSLAIQAKSVWQGVKKICKPKKVKKVLSDRIYTVGIERKVKDLE